MKAEAGEDGSEPAAPYDPRAGLHGSAAAGLLALELAFTEPEAAARLTRQAAWRQAAAGGARGGQAVPVSLVWHDTAAGPGGALARRGLALETPRGGPRRLLLRSLPEPGAPWRPGTPPEPVATLAGDAPLPDIAGLDAVERTAPLVPLATFEGCRTRFVLAGGESGGTAAAAAIAPAEAELLTGRLRANEAERAVARLLFTGPAERVLALARALAATLPLLPPRAALAEEARALALGGPVRPRRAGPPVLGAAPDARAALGLALGHLTEALLFHAPLARREAGPEGVHQMRVALRRLRSVLRLFRPVASAEEEQASLRAFEARLQALARTLGPARDWDVFLGGLGARLAAALPEEEEPRLAGLLRAAEARRAEAYTALRAALDGPEFRVLACDAIALALRCAAAEAPDAAAPSDAARVLPLDEAPPPPPGPEPLDRFAAAVLDRRWRKLRARGKAAEMAASPGDEALHALRLEGKRMRYAAEVFAPLWPGKGSRRFVKDLAALQEALGLANDAATARRLVAELALPATAPAAAAAVCGAAEAARREDRAWAIGLVEGFALARTRRVRKRALRAWESLLRREPFWKGR